MDTTFLYLAGIVLAQLSFSHLPFVVQLLSMVLNYAHCSHIRRKCYFVTRPHDLADNYTILLIPLHTLKGTAKLVSDDVPTRTRVPTHLFMEPLPRFLDTGETWFRGL